MSKEYLSHRLNHFISQGAVLILKDDINEFRTLLVKKGIKEWAEVGIGASLVIFYKKGSVSRDHV